LATPGSDGNFGLQKEAKLGIRHFLKKFTTVYILLIIYKIFKCIMYINVLKGSHLRGISLDK